MRIILSLAIYWGEQTARIYNVWPQSSYDRCLSLQVRVNVKRFTFSFNQYLAKVGTLTWQSVCSVIWVNGCVVDQNSWQESWVPNWKINRQRVRRLPTAYSALDKRMNLSPAHRNACFYLHSYSTSWMIDFRAYHYHMLHKHIYLSSSLVLNGKQCGILDHSTQTAWSIGAQAFHSTKNWKQI